MTRSPVFPYKLYLVISESDCRGRNFLEVAEQAILGGVDIIQLREKNDSTETFIRKATLLKKLTEKYQIPLIINDKLQIAKKVDAFGIHVGNRDLPPGSIRKQWGSNKYIGYSIERIEQLSNEQIMHSDYLGISPIFKTPTKTDTITEWGLNGIRKIREITDKPLVAIGNLNRHNVKDVIRAGADCIAVVSAICSATDPKNAAFELRKEILK